MANRFFDPVLQATDNSGISVPGAKLYFYASGTSTLQNTYSDDALTIANANPVIADGEGRFGDIFLLAADYKVVLKDADDVILWSRDPYDGTLGFDTSGLTFGTVAELKAWDISNESDGRFAFLRGYYADGDGGGGSFYYDKSSSETDNGGTILAPDAGTGRWKRLLNSQNASVKDFGAKGDSIADDTTALQATLDDSSTGLSNTISLPMGVYKTNKLNFNTAFQTTIIGEGSADTELAATNADGTSTIHISGLASDRYRPVLERFSITPTALSGHGVDFDSPTIGGLVNDLRIKGTTATGKAALNLTSAFIMTINDTLMHTADIGLNLASSKGVVGSGNWVADNTTVGINIDSSSKGNDIGFSELGLGTLDKTKKAMIVAGNTSRYTVQFYENYENARAITLTTDSYGNTLDILHRVPYGVYDVGDFNVYYVTPDIPLRNRTSSNSFFGALAGDNDLENQFSDSSFLGGATLFNPFGATSPTRTHDPAVGYMDSNSLSLAWGVDKFSGIESAQTFAVSSGDFITVSCWKKADRALEDGEFLQLRIFGAANESRAIEQISTLDGKWRPITVTYKAVATESITIAIDRKMRDPATGNDVNTSASLTTWLDDVTVSVNKNSFTTFRNDGSSTRSSDFNGAYIPMARIGKGSIDGGASLSGRLGSGYADVSTTGLTKEALATFALSAYTLREAGQAVRIKAWGQSAANGNAKQVTIDFGATTVANTGSLNANAKNFLVEATVVMASTSAQVSCGTAIFNDAIQPPLTAKPGETLSSSVNITINGTTPSAAGDLTLEGYTIELLS